MKYLVSFLLVLSAPVAFAGFAGCPNFSWNYEKCVEKTIDGKFEAFPGKRVSFSPSGDADGLPAKIVALYTGGNYAPACVEFIPDGKDHVDSEGYTINSYCKAGVLYTLTTMPDSNIKTAESYRLDGKKLIITENNEVVDICIDMEDYTRFEK